MNVLEIGCGLHRDPRATVAIDILPSTQADLVMDVHRMTFEAETFDRVLMFEVIEHLDSPFYALKEIHRVLKKDSTLEMSTPNPYYWMLIARWTVRGRVAASPGHRYNWTLWELSILLKSAGFELKRVWFGDEEWNSGRDPLMSVFLPRIGCHSIFVEAVKK